MCTFVSCIIRCFVTTYLGIKGVFKYRSDWNKLLVFFYSCPFLVEHLTVFIPVIGGVLCVFVLISLLRTSFTDPGILPRATPDEAADIEKQIGKTHPGVVYLLWDRWSKRALPYGESLKVLFVVELHTKT